MIITENYLDEWVRGNSVIAQGLIVDLIGRLVKESCPNYIELRFPRSDSTNQPGPDGVFNTNRGFAPFVPDGKSFWEIGTGNDAGEKATRDYRKLTRAISEGERKESTFVFVTPLSGRRGWSYDKQKRWASTRQRKKEWHDVKVIDGTKIIEWMSQFPVVEIWLACEMGFPAEQTQTPEQRWNLLSAIGNPPLIPQVFLANRADVCERLKDVFSGTVRQLRIDTNFPNQTADFIAAFVAEKNEKKRNDVASRCLIISSPDAWNAMTTMRDAHILVADFDMTDGYLLLEKAKNGGHSVVFSGQFGGPPGPDRVSMFNPKSYHIQDSLEKSGYGTERARRLALQCNGDLNSLIRLLQGRPLMPEWARNNDSADLAIALVLGSWKEDSQADKVVAENLSKKDYGEWVRKMREIALRPDTPLVHRNGVWKMVARFEGWYALGSRIFDEHLDRIKEVAVNVLSERDPQFELPKEERYLANIRNKVLSHSRSLRNGLAESLALLGSHPDALTSCSTGKAESTAVLAVRDILKDANWFLWASLNNLLPLLAEAAPNEFLNAVEDTLATSPCPFDTLFAQESTETISGANYMTGLLWALETLAWDANYLSRVVVILGELAARDPGGNWANRPINSLVDILLPWMPHTCAALPKRLSAIETLISEVPNVGWKLLLNLFPSMHEFSTGTRKPAWRDIIPEDWSSSVTQQDYWEQVIAYADLALRVADHDPLKLGDLVNDLSNLPPQSRDKIIACIDSQEVHSLKEEERQPLWTKLVGYVAKHRKFADAQWALEPKKVDKISDIAERMAPTTPLYRHQRLFGERDLDLYEEGDNYEELRRRLEQQRQKAISEVFDAGGMTDVLEFAKAVESPMHVGFSLGVIAPDTVEKEILPVLLESKTKSLKQFAGGFVWGRFSNRNWQWVDRFDYSQWTPSQKGQFLAYLPFVQATWGRATKLLGEDESQYWSKANAHPYDSETGIDYAIDRLVKYGRANAALRCITAVLYGKKPLNYQQAIQTLEVVAKSPENTDANDIITVIKALQDNPNANPVDMYRIEWAFLPLLGSPYGTPAKYLEQRLSADPDFFCDIIRITFRPEKDEKPPDNLTEQQKQIARNAHRLLDHWKIPPGKLSDGTFDGKEFSAWLEKVKAVCEESGHLKIALQMIGHVLIHTPPDPDGLWIHHSAAEALNAKEADDMRIGFRVALFNSRGTFTWTGGREERVLAEKYRKQAEDVEARNYHRLASALRELADSYERSAKEEKTKDFLDE